MSKAMRIVDREIIERQVVNAWKEKSEANFIREVESEGFDWKFMCILCVRAWRKRGLEREGVSDEAVMLQLDKEYPLN